VREEDEPNERERAGVVRFCTQDRPLELGDLLNAPDQFVLKRRQLCVLFVNGRDGAL
jgi:hypothetical protein